MAQQSVKSFLIKGNVLETLTTLAKENGASPEEVLRAIVRECRKKGTKVRVNRLWTLRAVVRDWKDQNKEAFDGPLSSDLVKQFVANLSEKLKETEVALSETEEDSDSDASLLVS